MRERTPPLDICQDPFPYSSQNPSRSTSPAHLAVRSYGNGRRLLVVDDAIADAAIAFRPTASAWSEAGCSALESVQPSRWMSICQSQLPGRRETNQKPIGCFVYQTAHPCEADSPAPSVRGQAGRPYSISWISSQDTRQEGPGGSILC